MAQVSTEKPGQNPYENVTPITTDAELERFLAWAANPPKSDEIVVDEHGREIPDPNDKPTRAEPLVD